MYAVLVYGQPGAYEALSADEQRRVFGEFRALTREPMVIDSRELPLWETPTTIRVSDGQVLRTDGPFADTKEVFGGYYLLDVDSVQDALAFAARVPAAVGGGVEVRPVTQAHVAR